MIPYLTEYVAADGTKRRPIVFVCRHCGAVVTSTNPTERLQCPWCDGRRYIMGEDGEVIALSPRPGVERRCL